MMTRQFPVITRMCDRYRVAQCWREVLPILRGEPPRHIHLTREGQQIVDELTRELCKAFSPNWRPKPRLEPEARH